MKLLYTSDIHASDSHLFSMLSVVEAENIDGLIVGGDIIPHYLPDENTKGILRAQAIYLKNVFIPALKDLKKKRDVKMYLDLANYDFISNRTILEDHEETLFHLLHMKKCRLTDTIDIIGYMNVPPTPFSRKDWEKPDSVQQPYTPGNRIRLDGHLSIKGRLEKTVINLASDDTIENDLSRLSEIIDRPFIFVSHSPPFQTPLDILYNNLHVGSSGIRNFIAKWSAKNRLIVSLHGHIHESPHRSGSISTTIQDTLCINPGQNSGSGVNLRYVVFKISETSGKPSIDILKSM